MESQLIQEILEDSYPELTPLFLAALDDACKAGIDQDDNVFSAFIRERVDSFGRELIEDLDDVTLCARIRQGLQYESLLQDAENDYVHSCYNELRVRRNVSRFEHGKKNDKYLFFAHPRHEPDFGKWMTFPKWTLEEAVALSLRKSPETINKKSLATFGSRPSAFKNEFDLRLETARRTFEKDLIPVIEAVNFLKRRFTIPDEMEAVYALSMESLAEELQHSARKIEDLKNELKEVKARLTEMGDEPEDFDKRGTWAKLIYCMAKAKYGYPARGCIAAIEKDIIKIAAAEPIFAGEIVGNTISNNLAVAARMACGG